ncbi:MAG: hypothetical protein M1814_001399 [Vezdaea aestivalis]|nr:MAG: hypothetical protein M1814_001399 [Vezdaea aestivalis]
MATNETKFTLNEANPQPISLTTHLPSHPILYQPSLAMITLWVGNQIFYPLKSTLLNGMSGYFAFLLNSNGCHRADDEKLMPPIFIDADPTLFPDILRFVRYGAYPVKWDPTKGFDYEFYARLLVEAEFYQIGQLSKWIREKDYRDCVRITVQLDEMVKPEETVGKHHGDVSMEMWKFCDPGSRDLSRWTFKRRAELRHEKGTSMDLNEKQKPKASLPPITSSDEQQVLDDITDKRREDEEYDVDPESRGLHSEHGMVDPLSDEVRNQHAPRGILCTRKEYFLVHPPRALPPKFHFLMNRFQG